MVQDLLRRLVAPLDQDHRILSLCAGDGRDIIPVVAAIPPARRPALVLVELDDALAEAGRQRATAAGVAATVITGDAGDSATWRCHTPVDLLMLCGVFGNIPAADVQRTIGAARSVVVPQGAVLWTRGARGDDDPRPQAREWFREAGFDELAYEAEAVGYGVGVNRAAAGANEAALPARLFSFSR